MSRALSDFGHWTLDIGLSGRWTLEVGQVLLRTCSARDDVQLNLDHVAQKSGIGGLAEANTVVFAIYRCPCRSAKRRLAGFLVAIHAVDRERKRYLF